MFESLGWLFMVLIKDYIRESNTIENVHSENAIDSSYEAWIYLIEKECLNHEIIKNVHYHILKNRQPSIAGQYRNKQVYVGGYIPTKPQNIKSEMRNLLDFDPKTGLEAIEWHVDFEKIHPFQDGNGRVGRLIYLWHCNKINIEPIIWTKSNRKGYYDLFKSISD